MLKNEVSLQNLYLCQQKSHNKNWGTQSINYSQHSPQNHVQGSKCGKCLNASVYPADTWLYSRTAVSCWVYSPRHSDTTFWCPHLYPGTQKVLLGHGLHVRDLTWPRMFLHHGVPLVSPLVFVCLTGNILHISKLHPQSWKGTWSFTSKSKELYYLEAKLSLINTVREENSKSITLWTCNFDT